MAFEYEKVFLEDNGVSTRPRRSVLFNGKLTLRVVVIKRDEANAWSSPTCTLTVYDSTQTSVLTASITPTTSGKDRADCQRILNAASAGDLTAVGEYMAVVKFVHGSYTREIQIPVTVRTEKS